MEAAEPRPIRTLSQKSELHFYPLFEKYFPHYGPTHLCLIVISHWEGHKKWRRIHTLLCTHSKRVVNQKAWRQISRTCNSVLQTSNNHLDIFTSRVTWARDQLENLYMGSWGVGIGLISTIFPAPWAFCVYIAHDTLSPVRITRWLSRIRTRYGMWKAGQTDRRSIHWAY